MADKPISYEKLVNADKDADTLEQVTSADKNTTVVSRLGRQYPSLAKALQTIMDAGGFKPYSTEAELKASVPVIVPSAAYAFDTKKVWLWNGSAWVDEGTSALDQAKEFTQEFIFMSNVVVNNVPYLHALVDKNGRVHSGVTAENIEMKNIGGAMKEINNNFQDEVFSCKEAVIDNTNHILEKTCENGRKHSLSQTHDVELSQTLTKADLNTFDVVIYGSGAGALTAARTAKENGLSVCLICPDYRVGGMMSAGVSVFDGPTQAKAAEIGGINKVFQGHTRRLVLEISTYYGSSLLPNSTTFEPRVAQKVCNDWCNRYVDLLILDQQIHDSFTSVSVDNGRIVGIWTKRGFIKGNCFIDASYTGDLLRFSGASWTFDVEAASDKEPQAGAQVNLSFKKQNLDLTTVGLSGATAIDALQRAEYTVVPNLTDPSIPAAGAAIPNMTIGYGTRGIVTNAADRIPFTAYKLDSYDRRNHLVYLAILLTENFTGLSNSDIVRKAIGSQGTVRSLSGETLFNTNNALFAQTSRLAKDYPIANWKRRRQIEKEIIEHYVNLCYFLATDSAVPANIKTAMLDFGHSPREWIDSPYGVGIQFKVYDRQAIRMINDNVVNFYDLSQKYTTNYFNDPIGIFAYFFDGKKRLCFAAPATSDDKNWTLIEESRITVNEDSPLYALPMRMLLPRKTECTNLVVAWCSAQTELAFHSCRMEATGGMQGEAAAAICISKIKNKLRTVQDVQYSDVRTILLNQNVFLG